MSKIRLKRTILEIVENQLKDEELPEVNQAYQKLLDAGYTAKEAKEKIGAVVLTEIYDVLKKNQPYNKKRYMQALEEMVQQCIDLEDTHAILTEWDQWDELVQRGYEVQNTEDYDTLVKSWWEAWKIFQDILEETEGKCSVSDLMEDQDYQYPIDGWLQDLEMELGNAGEHEKRFAFCQSVLEMMDWTYDDDSSYRSAIGEELYASGKAEEGKAWFETWLKEEPHNECAWSAFSWCVQEQEGEEKAYQLIRNQVIGTSCTIYNSLLFERAKPLAEHLELTDDLKWIESQLKSFRKVMEKRGCYPDLYDEFCMPVQKPIVKEKKVYPNDPCPCGSGKKYKKCCGKK